MSVSTHIKGSPRTSTGLCAGKRAHPVGGVFDHVNRRGGVGFCDVRHCPCECSCPVGAGSTVTERSRAAISAGASGKAAPDSCHLAARSRRSVGDGGRVALHLTGGCDWRGLGRSARAGFYRHKAFGNPGRGQQSALLAGAPGSHARSECGAKPLAHFIPAIAGASPRSASPRRSAMAGGAVPVTSGASRNMGGHL